MNGYLLALRSIDRLSRHTLAPWGRMRMRRQGATVTRDVAYGPEPVHRLDIYRPNDASTPCPAVFYLHGGGFTALSKNSHVGVARAFLRLGVAVVVPDYHLAPEHPFPAALGDAARAWGFIVAHAAAHGIDPKRLILAGESAGANLALALTLATCAPLSHPAVAAVHAHGVTPGALLALCGLLQVSDAGRYRSGPDAATPFVQQRLTGIARAYLGDAHAQFDAARALADPLVMLERGYSAEAPLPATFIGVGALDPIVADSRRLAEACKKRSVPHRMRIYPEAGHAFFAVRRNAQAAAFWDDVAAFVATHRK